MRSWKYLRIGITSSGVGVGSTDAEALNWVATLVRKHLPASQVDAKEKLPTGEVYSIFLTQLHKQDFPVGHLILKQLCLNGWEPIAVNELTGSEGTTFGPEYHLRLEATTQ